MGKKIDFNKTKCWSEDWTNKYGKPDISNLIGNKTETEETKVIQLKFLEEEEYRSLFYEWKQSIRNQSKYGRFNNDIDKIRKPIGMNILKYPLIKRQFDEWLRKQKYISKIG